ncbi:MAG TPA: methionine ABC transporter ATP-binding protein [Limnochordales bacterium]|nr:methionine ABC transporter ATP-binding protein [Limnochordales bacterium]
MRIHKAFLNGQGTAPAPAGTPMLRLVNVEKTYGRGANRVQALRGVSLEVMRGEIFGIIGLSGAGKSTLIRCINLLERPQAGRVYIDGVDVTDYKGRALRTVRRHIGMVFQHFNLLTNRTALGNVTFPMEIVGVPRRERERRALELLEFVGLREKAHRYPAELSGGEKQRVGIARALATEPRLLLCDEPTSALDPETTAAFLNLLKDINRRLGLTIVMVTHQMHVVRAVCSRVAVLDQGRVAELGPVVQVFDAPQTEAARRLVKEAAVGA